MNAKMMEERATLVQQLIELNMTHMNFTTEVNGVNYEWLVTEVDTHVPSKELKGPVKRLNVSISTRSPAVDKKGEVLHSSIIHEKYGPVTERLKTLTT